MELIQSLVIFTAAALFAKLEIYIEGRDGWAKNLPTPRFTRGKTATIARQLIGADLTGYHVCIFGIGLVLFNIPFVFGAPFTWNYWLHVMSLYFLFIVLWDFLWFILNPAYGLRKFKKKHIQWHQGPWIAGMPVLYVASVALSLFCHILNAEDTAAYTCVASSLALLLGLTFVMKEMGPEPEEEIAP